MNNEIIIPIKRSGLNVMGEEKYAVNDGNSIIIGELPKDQFPPKERLYGEGAMPHVFTSYANHPAELDLKKLGELKAYRCNTILLFNDFYTNFKNPAGKGTFGKIFYEYKNPEAIKRFIAACHKNGFRVISYIYQPTDKCWQAQPPESILLSMDKFASEHDLDGWYIDGGSFGTYKQTLYAFRHLRAMNKVLYLHDSVSLIGGCNNREKDNPYGDIPSVIVLRYCDYTLCNEVFSVWQPKTDDDPVWEKMIDPFGSVRAVKWADRSPMRQEELYVAAAKKGFTVPLKFSNIDTEAFKAYWKTYQEMREEWQKTA